MAHEIDDETFLSSFRIIMRMSMIIQSYFEQWVNRAILLVVEVWGNPLHQLEEILVQTIENVFKNIG
jgi:hypothetical protein